MTKKSPVVYQASQNEKDPAAPKIEFPCSDYPIKVIGHNVDGFKEYVIDVMCSYDNTFDVDKVTFQDSKNGRFRSVRMFMTAQSKEQLVALNAEFKASGKVVTVI